MLPRKIEMIRIRLSSGVGTALIEAAREVALQSGCKRLWLITTNDNLNALRFYQKRRFMLVAIHRNALEVSRRLKPGISLIGYDGIPLRDEIELEMLLAGLSSYPHLDLDGRTDDTCTES
jgi:Acetyltransferase (GNAT) family